MGIIRTTLLAATLSVVALGAPAQAQVGSTPANAVGTPTTAREHAVAPGDRLHIQFTGRLRVPKSADAVELDGENTSKRQVRRLKRRGKVPICYISAGSWESYRSDAKRYPKRLLGNVLDGWPDERWLDIRRRSALRPVIERRVRQCARKGFKGVEFDSVDGYQNRTGFAIKRKAQLRFNRMLARMAKRHGLSPGLKNAVGLIKSLSHNFDWALNEECVTYRECSAYRPFIRKGKAVLILEYGETSRKRVCRAASRLGATAQVKRLRLSAWARHC